MVCILLAFSTLSTGLTMGTVVRVHVRRMGSPFSTLSTGLTMGTDCWACRPAACSTPFSTLSTGLTMGTTSAATWPTPGGSFSTLSTGLTMGTAVLFRLQRGFIVLSVPYPRV